MKIDREELILMEKDLEKYRNRACRVIRTAMLQTIRAAFPNGVAPYVNDFDKILDTAIADMESPSED